MILKPNEELDRANKATIKLWKLLDDVSTASDMFKPHNEKSYKQFYEYVMIKVAFRSEVTHSPDGYGLVWPNGDILEGIRRPVYAHDQLQNDIEREMICGNPRERLLTEGKVCDACEKQHEECANCSDCDCCVYHIHGGNKEYACGPEKPTEENNRLRQLLHQMEYAYESTFKENKPDGEAVEFLTWLWEAYDGYAEEHCRFPTSEELDKYNRVRKSLVEANLVVPPSKNQVEEEIELDEE